MKKVIFPFIFWGKTYAEDLSNYCLKSLLNEIKNINKNLFQIEIAIWSCKEDFNLVKQKFKNESKNFNFVNIKPLLANTNFKKLNKYQFLNIIQILILTKYKKKYDYLFFLYPDFIWSNYSIENIFNKIEKYDLFLVYAPQIIKENYIKDIGDSNIKNIDPKYIYENLHPIVTSNTVNTKNSFNTGACISFKFKNYYILRNFHLHPLCIALKSFSDKLLNPFYISLDEDFIGNLNIDKKRIFIPKSSHEMMFASLCGINEITIPKIKNNSIYKIQNWIQTHAYKNHIIFSKNNFYLENKKSIKNDKDKNYVEQFMKKFYEKINLKSTDLFNKENYIYLIDRKAHLKKIKKNYSDPILDFHNNKISHIDIKNNRLNKNVLNFLKENIYDN